MSVLPGGCQFEIAGTIHVVKFAAIERADLQRTKSRQQTVQCPVAFP